MIHVLDLLRSRVPFRAFAYSYHVQTINNANNGGYHYNHLDDEWWLRFRCPISDFDDRSLNRDIIFYIFLQQTARKHFGRNYSAHNTPKTTKIHTFSWYLRMMIIIGDDCRWCIIIADDERDRRTDADNGRTSSISERSSMQKALGQS